MLLSVALSTASRRRGLAFGSLPPSLAATVISRIRREKILPRLASDAALRCLMFAHLLWPAMAASRRDDAEIIRARSRGALAARMAKGRPKPFGQIRLGAKHRASEASETSPRSEKSLLFQKLRKGREPNFRVVDLEHALLDRQRQRQDLGEAVADPGSVSQREIVREILLAYALDEDFQEFCQRLERFGERHRRFRRDVGDLPYDKPVVGDRVRPHLEARESPRPDVEDAELRHIPVGDPRPRPDRGERYVARHRRSLHLFALREQAYPERRVVLEAGLGHRHVSLLEHLERQQPAGEEHGLERKERQRDGLARGRAVHGREHTLLQARSTVGGATRASPHRGPSSCTTPS